VIPLEVWDLEIAGGMLFDARGEHDFGARLVEAVARLRRGDARRRAGAPLDVRCREIAALVIGGGGAARAGLAGELARVDVPWRIDPAGAFCGEAGGFALLGERGGLVLDAGQVALKISWTPRGRLRVARDFSSLPANGEATAGTIRVTADQRAPNATAAHRERVREFFGGAIARAVEQAGRAPARVVMALPAELDDALVPGACSYPSLEGDGALIGDVMARAGLAGAPVLALNDAELAALSARASGLAPAGVVTLVLTLGWGVGGALVVPDA
jgi:hypothetical protein